MKEATLQQALDLGLLEEEFEHIKQLLGRTPNFTEVSIYSVMWSEHCSYKNSIRLLKTLPRKGPHLLAEAGEENAGLVDIGDGLACAFKIESHNHPSAVEPYQGAATGVGGIHRDIFTMGARPIAALNSLRFGAPDSERTQHLMSGVVKGIGDYGNSFGVPTVAGEVYFEECYEQNILVNAMSIGVVRKGQVVSAIAEGVGNPVFIVGSRTGKDGIHGATFASEDLGEDAAERLPSVQVGDPFQEKLLLEASLEAIATGGIVGMQDMGAAGITCSTSEMAAKGGVGMDVWLDKVPTRQEGMLPFEILLSESQERMLVVLEKGREADVIAVFEKWDLQCVQIAEVTAGDTLRYFVNDTVVAEVSAESLVLGGGAPIYQRETKEPAYVAELAQFDASRIAVPSDLRAVGMRMIARPNIASKRWVYRQYDSMVGAGTMTTNRPSDAAVIRVHDSDKTLAATVDCNGRYVHADPVTGAAIAVSECARNLSCSGAEPTAITNCLNFGNPYNPEVYWQFAGVIEGMSLACTAFQTPVTGGNVSFYNQNADGQAVYPTPTIGMLGIIHHRDHRTTLSFAGAGDTMLLLGRVTDNISCSEYVRSEHGVKWSPVPYFNIEEEEALCKAIRKAIIAGNVKSAHDVSDGGLWVTMLESGFQHGVGFNIKSDASIRTDAWLFGEGQGRALISCDPSSVASIEKICEEFGVLVTAIGETTEGSVIVNGERWDDIRAYQKRYEETLPMLMGEQVPVMA